MPTYDYECKACGERFEIQSSLAVRDRNAVCPACGGRDVEQRFGGFTVGIHRTRLNPGTFVRGDSGESDKPRHVEPGKP